MRRGIVALAGVWTWLSAPSVSAYDEVCGKIEIEQKKALAANPGANPVAIPIRPTLDCIKNFTVGWQRTYRVMDMLNQMDQFLDFETTLDSLKNPPSDWPYPPHDVRARLQEVKDKVTKNQYANEYDFEVDLFEKVYAPAHSGHLIYYPDLLTNPWWWARNVPLVSVSKDGLALPEIFFRDDVLKSVSNASPLVKIDGKDANKFIEDLVFRAASQDPDAGYNAMFYNKAFVAAKISNNGYFAQGGRTNNIYPGESTTYTFKNGTSITVNNTALLKFDFTGASNNFYFFNRYSGFDRKRKPFEMPQDSPGYPTPIIATKDGNLGGYYLEGGSMDDVAVLSVLSFTPSSVVEFQAVAEKFLADAAKDGKKKLVIDLSANNGGYILSGYDLFRQLFPQHEQVGLTRFRNHPLVYGEIRVNEKIVPKNFDPEHAETQQIAAWQRAWSYQNDLDQNGNHFNSSMQKFANHTYMQSQFSSLMSWNLEDPYLTVKGPTAFGTEITGYGSRKNFKQPFKAEDIVVLTDGFCASTCFLFTDFLSQVNVRTVVVGGRPELKPMQAVGGVKGGQLNTWDNLHSSLYQDQFYLWQNNMTDPDQAWMKEQFTDHLYYLGWTASAGINLRDVVQEKHIKDGKPAQFVREEADCRLFYTGGMLKDVVQTWAKAAEVAWYGAKCAVGGIKGNAKRREVIVGRDVRSAAVGETKIVNVEVETTEKNAEWLSVHGQKAFE